MKAVLGKKQTSSHTDWLRVFSNIEQYVSKQETDNLVDRLVEQVKPHITANVLLMLGVVEKIALLLVL